MLHKRRSFGMRKVSPPQPTCMTSDQKATYLQDLRTNRPARPVGSRPLPTRPAIPRLRDERHHDSAARNLPDNLGENEQAAASKRHSISNAAALGSAKGRPLVQAPAGIPTSRKVTPPEVQYRESTARQMEKKEAHLLRKALEEGDLGDDEERIYQAAQMEAADLVWKHRNPELAQHEVHAPYRNPDIPRKKYVITDGSALDQSLKKDGRRTTSGESTYIMSGAVQPLRPAKRLPPDTTEVGTTQSTHGDRRRSSGSRKVSNKSLFRNPQDQIYEEPSPDDNRSKHEKGHAAPLQATNPNSYQHSRPLPEKPPTLDKADSNTKPQYHLQNTDFRYNPISRSATPEERELSDSDVIEIRSEDIRAATRMRRADRSPNLPTPTAVSDRPGRPIVSFDPSWKPGSIAAQASVDAGKTTSRSKSLSAGAGSPRSSLDADKPAVRPLPVRPIQDRLSNGSTIRTAESPNLPSITVSDDSKSGERTPSPVPNIVICPAESTTKAELPEIDVSSHDDANYSTPSINIEPEQKAKPAGPVSRPLPLTSRSVVGRVPWLSRGSAAPPIGAAKGPTVSCTACDVPISGRIVTAAGAADGRKARFHPHCFTCFHCKEELECISFYPEPETARLERLGIGQLDKLSIRQVQKSTTAGIDDLRFYCHVDFHDLFSPRCGSCHTPIEGAVILAAGKSWHEGHFFCAECGDPFSSSSPFVESKGYAYCVGCHTKRTSARCRACKNQILDEISVEALGAKWHEGCFCCNECGGDFGDDGRFFVREIEVELTEKEKRKGMTVGKVEERAVCDGCEQRRLKSRHVLAFL